MVLLLLATGLSAAPQHLPQNWSATDRDWFYTTPQGSKLMPYKWALSLERANSEELFFADNLARLGYLPNPKSKDNPDGLPVGFVRDRTLTAEHLGMTCAACHTNQVDYQGTSYQIDGAPTDADLFGLLAEFSESLNATAASATDPKFLRFAKRVLGRRDTAHERTKLYGEVKSFARTFTEFVDATVSPTVWGPARADAFGAIFNRVTAIDLHLPANNRAPNAPVSYPFLWDISWHNLVQWNGSAPNTHALLRLARNVGEVLGVFADINLQAPTKEHPFYVSTAKRINLLEIEDRLANLRSPRWTDTNLPALDAAKVARGQQLYNDQCLSCHIIETPGKSQKVTMTPQDTVGTDKQMAFVAATRTAKTGVLNGAPKYVIFGDPLSAEEGAGTITFNAVVGAILSPVPDALFIPKQPTKTASASSSTRTGEGSEHDLRIDLLNGSKSDVQSDLQDALQAAAATPTPTVLAYKARPLDGIWATAPYLHNGSVPTLYDLLLPAAQRPKTFKVGSRELDPAKVGFTNDGSFTFDTTIMSNSNAGHDWGTTLNDEDRAALIEYLKSL